MTNLLSYSLLAFVLFLFVKRLVVIFIVERRVRLCIAKSFSADRLYTASEVASIFRIPIQDFHRIISTLEQYNYFAFFRKRGVVMVKDYYSQYEIKYLLKILYKKNKLK